MKTILVTGGAGFLGSHLCERLLRSGNHVICVDNFFTGQRRNIEPFIGHRHFELVRHDIVQPLHVEVEQIYNLACPASPIHYQFNPIKTIKCSTVGMVNMLGLARRTGARILQASTSEIYGDPEVHPQPETYRGNVNPIGERSCYDEGKRVAEALCMDYHRSNGVDIRLIRIFNTYGPNMHPEDGRVVSNFIVQSLRAEDLTVYGGGGQTRSFCYVDDLIEGMVRMMNQDEFIGPVNLGNPEEITIAQLARKVIELTQSPARLIDKPLPSDDPRQRQPDITLAQRQLGWNPAVSLHDGLSATIAYFKELLAELESEQPEPQAEKR